MLRSLEKFALSDEQMSKLEKYSLLMQKWNQRIQMTATRDVGEFVSRHVVDSLELASELSGENSTMIDVGSGGGLPGLVLAIAHPRMTFTLIEPIKKKHAFLAAAKRELGLQNIETFALRDEELLGSPTFKPFDFAVARAVWALEIWLERGQSLVRPGGVVFGMEGKEVIEIPPGATRRSYVLDGDRSRAIIRLQTELPQ